MLKDITTLQVLGANFDSSTSFGFFHDGSKNKTVKGALLYGRNGTGKSTIARAFRKATGETVPVINVADFYDDAARPVILTEEEKKHIFIFDEDYVYKNVRLQQDYLETIVMLGQAADLAERLTQAEAERDAAKFAYEQQYSIYQEYDDGSNVKSPKYYISLLCNALRGDDKWAGRDKEINGNRQNTSVRDDTYKKFVTITPSKLKTELIAAYKAKLKELEAAKTGASVITIKVPPCPDDFKTYNDNAITQLLEKSMEKPKLSEREQKLFALLQEGRSEALSQKLALFRKDETVECPYCFQAISPDYKKALTESIERVLSKVVENHQKELKRHIFGQLGIDLSPYEKLDNYQVCVDLMSLINSTIQENNANLERKIANPYEPIFCKISNVKALVTQFIMALADLENKRVTYNNTVKQTEPIIKDLNQINNEITHYDVENLAVSHDKQQKEYVAARDLCQQRKAVYDEKQKIVEELEAQKKNIHLALDTINACMKYIFFADDRLKLEYSNGAYKLLSHGRSVKPCDVSVGERNIIGLSYFFTSILEGREEQNAYGEEYLIVIDDPVSSYDMENKIGILSFLKYKLSVFLEGNPNTKALVMTHDLTTFYDLQKVFEEIMDMCKQKGYSCRSSFFELHEGIIKPFCNKRQEYTEILKMIYMYAVGQDDTHELIIGNMMRQALEAFSTFEYKKGIEDVSTNTEILQLLSEQEYIVYYRNLMYRLVLHGGSHREEQVKSMKDFHFFSLISETEKQRTARDVLCFIYLLNKTHLLEHLKKCKDVEDTLKSWCLDIKRRAAVI